MANFIEQFKGKGKIASKAFDNEWTPDLLDDYYKCLEEIAVGEWGYDIYPNDIQIVDSIGMLEAYASTGLPIIYPHWSHGKRYAELENYYRRGKMGLALEMIVNSSPAISYFMEENTLTAQILVMAHACFGHNHYFKNNYMFKQFTMADYIIEYLKFAKRYVEYCEEKYGMEEVERTLDAAHTIGYYSVDRYTKKHRSQKESEEDRKMLLKWEEEHFDPLQAMLIDPKKKKKKDLEEIKIDPTENLLYFIETNSIGLKDWQRQLVKIVRKINQYFYPQRQNKLSNEGFATFTHHSLCHELNKRGLVDESFMLEFCYQQSAVCFQPDYNSKYWQGYFNPYSIGHEIFFDIKRICEEPTKEDEEWFPELVGKPAMPTILKAVENFKDESLIGQYLSPHLIRKYKMFALLDKHPEDPVLHVSNVSDEQGYRRVREIFSNNWDTNAVIPKIEVVDVKKKSDFTLLLRHQMYKQIPLQQDEAMKVLHYIKYLWGYPVEITSYDGTAYFEKNSTEDGGGFIG